MTIRTLSYISLSDLSLDPSWASHAFQSNSGAGLVGNKLTINPAYQISTIQIDDDDDAFEDDDNGDRWNDNGTAQTLAANTVLNGRLYAAGTAMEAEYKLTLTYLDGDGVLQRCELVAVKAGSQIVGFTFVGSIPPSGTPLNIVSNSDSIMNPDGSYTAVQVPYTDLVPCFAAGVLLQTESGPVPVEDIAVGDLVVTRDNGLQPVRWIGSRQLSPIELAARPQLRPIRIKAGALGAGTPSSDLIVSPQHRILVRSRISQRMFGAEEVLVAAKQLLQMDGIDIASDLEEVVYHHILLDRHEIIIANGTETESLYTGKTVLESVSPAAREEIFAIFPVLRDSEILTESARLMPSGRQARRLAVRHVQNQRALVC